MTHPVRSHRPTRLFNRGRSGLLGAACVCLLVLFARTPYAEAAPSSQDLEFFEQQVRPILAENCFKCHGPDKQKAGLRLDHISFIQAGGEDGPVLVSGRPNSSRIIEAIGYDNADLQMPPPGKLSDDKIAVIRRWITIGAPWPKEPVPKHSPSGKAFNIEKLKREHWAWKPIQRPQPPTVKNTHWPINPIDRFILARLEAQNLSPAPQADKRTLIRRLSFDLIGLPPTPAQVSAFLNDPSPHAYDTLVNQLLASPRFGERWARHWLDLMRYAETYGHEFDYPIPYAYKYRDYVIRAFNNDVPYNRFLTEHFAGDLIRDPRINPDTGLNESLIATGFWWLSQATHAPVDVRQDEAERVNNQIDVMSKAFLGLTVNCARCHNHKFDPISQKDFYALAGFFRSSHRQLAYLDPHGRISQGAASTRALRDDATAALVKAMPASDQAASITPYLLAARQVLYGTPRPSDGVDPVAPNIVFDDFESGDYTRWTVQGEAFGHAPATGTLPHQSKITGFEGRFLVNSFIDRDKAQGRLISQPFQIKRRYIQFLIAGGKLPGRVSFNLRIHGAVVRSATGQNSARLVHDHWDVSEYLGREATLEIVDNTSAVWGHIDIDSIVFTDRLKPSDIHRPVQAVAREFDLNADILQRWVDALRDSALDNPIHPLYAFKTIAATPDAEERIDDLRQRLVSQLKKQIAAAEKQPYEVFEDFNGPESFKHWFVTGQAFGDGPTDRRTWRPAKDAIRLAPGGMAHSGALANKLQGAMRSRTFVIKHRNIHYRMAGRGGRIRVIIDGYFMDKFNALLFSGVSFNVNTDGRFVWHNQTGDIGRYIGHKAHIEILDDGDGWVAVDQIRFSDGNPIPKEQLDYALRVIDDPSISTMESLADACDQMVHRALSAWRQNTLNTPQTELLDWMLQRRLVQPLATNSNFARTRQHLLDVAGRINNVINALPPVERALAIADGSGQDEYLFLRGLHKNQGPWVHRRFLQAISGEDQPPIKHGSGRLDLARRILAHDNPFPARVMANRVWHHLFGRGIVPTTDNFGVLGQPPSHPRLLDYLADWFRSDAHWSVKKLIKLIVTSRTYRMSSKPADPVAEHKDPTNSLLHRVRVRRLEGEVIRDAILAISHRLDDKMFGPSVPVHLTSFMDGRGRPPKSGPLDGDGRRSIYLEIRRNFLSPMMTTFDTPIPYTAIGRRSVSNIPAQALILMNDPFVVKQADTWAEYLLKTNAASAEQRVNALYQSAFARPPSNTELNEAIVFLNAQAKAYGLDPGKSPNDPRPWTDLCHVLFNVKEFIYID